MGFIELTRAELNAVFTENGDAAYGTTGSYCLDYFTLIGASRFQYKNAVSLFLKAYHEDKALAVKITFYLRDIRNGLGERNLFRMIFNTLADFYPDVAEQLIPYIPVYGRYDDLFCALQSPVRESVISFVRKQLDKDLANLEKGKPVSLLGKWLPSENASSVQTKELASEIRTELGLTHGQYRQMLSLLREGTIVETSLVHKDYSFDYSKLPAGAFHKYRKAFERNDYDRYEEFIADVTKGKKEVHAKTLYPYQIVRDIRNEEDPQLDSTYEALWSRLVDDIPESKTMVVLDSSGSMYDGNNPSAIDVGVSCAVLFANKLKGQFHNRFITFSETPCLVELKGKSLRGWLEQVYSRCEAATTNLEKVFRLVESIYSRPDFKKEDALDRLVIISDMEFNALSAPYPEPRSIPGPSNIYGPRALISTYQSFKQAFDKKGLVLPEIVYWDVAAREVHFVAPQDAKGLKFVSGFSSNLIKAVVNNASLDPYDNMLKTLEPYKEFDKIKF